jgi:hypothetical protein
MRSISILFRISDTIGGWPCLFKEFPADSSKSMIINEAAARLYGIPTRQTQ